MAFPRGDQPCRPLPWLQACSWLAHPALAAFPSKDRWVEYLRAAGLRVLAYPEDTEGPGADLSRVEFAICWSPAPGLLKRVRPPPLAAVHPSSP